MHYKILILSIFFVVTTGQNYGLYHFSGTKATLLKCLEEHIWHSADIRVRGSLVDSIARKFSRRTVTKEYINLSVAHMVTNFYNRNHAPLINNQRLGTQLEVAIKKALFDCSDDNTRLKKNSYEPNDLPHFIDERSDIGRLLDYILVNWPYLRENMIYNRVRRAILRRYVVDALNIFELIYYCNDDDIVEYMLQSLWSRRARLFFDGRNTLLSYVDHRYTMDYPFPHTLGNTDVFIGRRSENYRDRNPLVLVSQSQYDLVLNINPVCQESDNNETHYISSTQFYYDIHKVQFYRILFFFLELQARGIRTDDDDTYEGPIPFDVVPNEIQAIIWNDTVYQDYLLKRDSDGKNSCDPEDSCGDKSENSYFINPEALLMSFWTSVKSGVQTTSTTVSTTTTDISTRTTNKYEDSKKGKGKFFRVASGKCFLKRQFDGSSSGDSNNDESGTIGPKRFKGSQKMAISYGFVTWNEKNKTKPFPDDEVSIILRMLDKKLKSACFEKINHVKLGI